MKRRIEVSANLDSFFCSSQKRENKFQRFEDILDWIKEKNRSFVVEQIPFSRLSQWGFTQRNQSIVHDSGRFFRIEGLRVKTNYGHVRQWDQPIINQPEIGILGILTKVFDNTRYFLMQVKMEPGNVNILQLSPTVQATKSNFSRVHQGKLPTYLEYFLDPSKSNILIDQLQTEQGGRFLRKRNRNMVVDVEGDVEFFDDFRWLTLGEIKKLLTMDNMVNMDARSVISTIPLLDDDIIREMQRLDIDKQTKYIINGVTYEDLNLDIIRSASINSEKISSKDQIISWYTAMKVNFEMEVEQVPLSELKGWVVSDVNIKSNDRFFSVIGVRVEAGSREVQSWCQPLIKDENIGLLGFIAKKINGVLSFLVQAKVEPGNLDKVELSPTVSCSNIDYLKLHPELQPPFFKYFVDESLSCHILFDALQSEEGGRFYHVQNRNKIIVLDENIDFNLPANFCWMTLNQMMEFMRYSLFNIEARSLISCIDIKGVNL